MSDQISSTRIVTDDNGDVVYSAAHGPYGAVQKKWTNYYNPKLKFSGKEREDYSDLDYFGARYYDHNSYRFISVDPIINKSEAMVNPQLWNLYSYCRNNPITFIDPDGRDVNVSVGNTWLQLQQTWGNTRTTAWAGEMAKDMTENMAMELCGAGVTALTVKGFKWLKRIYKTRRALKGLLKAPKWVKDSGSFVKWMENIQKSGKTLTKAQADKIVKQARKYGVKLRLDKPHINTKWDVPHLNIGKKGQAHVRVPKGYKLPD
jgi:RHS repeat-associated protein